MKICFLTHAFPPAETAASSYSSNFVNELLKNDLEVVVITSRRNGSAKMMEKYDNLSIYRVDFKLPIFADFFEFMMKVAPVLENAHKTEGFDLVHSEHLFPAPYAGEFAKNNKLPHIVTIEGVSNVSPYSRFLFEVHKFLLPKIKYDALVSWGRYVLEKYFLKWGVNKRKSAIIPGAVDTNVFNPKVDGSSVRRKLPKADKIILAAKPMYFTNALGMSHIIRAMEIVSNEHSDCKLVIGGTGRMQKYLVGLADKLDLNDKIEFVGWIPQKAMPKYYKAADIIVDSFVFSHPGSITALESLASGTPNVMTEIECLPGEINVPPKDIAVLSKVADEKSIADGIIALLDDERIGKNVGKNAVKFVEKNFSIETVAKKYIDLYSNTLDDYIAPI